MGVFVDVAPRWVSLSVLHEYERILKKGWWLLLAVVANLLWLHLYRLFCLTYWTQFTDYCQESVWPYVLLLSAATWLAHFLTLLFYCLVQHFGWFASSKISQKAMWDIDPEGWPRLRNRSLILNVINIYLVGPAALSLGIIALGFQSKDLRKPVPSMQEMAGHVYFCILVESCLFFLMHIVGHKYMYRWHKVHHEFKVPHALAGIHSDPFDYTIGTVLPTAAGIILLVDRMHFMTAVYWAVWRLCEGISNHCNYEFNWSMFRIIPFSAGPSYHEFHHIQNVGNYGSFMALHDSVTNTNEEYYRSVESKYI